MYEYKVVPLSAFSSVAHARRFDLIEATLADHAAQGYRLVTVTQDELGQRVMILERETKVKS